MCSAWISQKTATISVYSINLSVFITKAESLTAHYELDLQIRYSFVLRGSFFLWRLQPNRGLCPPRSWGFSRSRSDTPQLVRLLWTSDQPVAETSTWQHTTLHNRQTSMPPVGFEPTISAGERPQTYALDCAANGTGVLKGLIRPKSRWILPRSIIGIAIR